MVSAFGFGDALGPAKVIHVHNPAIGLNGVLVVDNVAAGPSIGGLRMAPDVTTVECFRLARAMTLKNAAAGLPHGGGKSVLKGDPRMPRAEKETLIRAFACALGDIQDYIFGPDMGTDEMCMGWIQDEIGRAIGLPREVGGIPLDELGATGWGLFHAIDVALEYCDFEMAGARIVIQGFGAVGRNVARFLEAEGAIIIAASDSRGAVYNETGLDVGQLTKLKAAGKSVGNYDRGEIIDREDIVGIPCNIWIPAARPDVITERNVELLDANIVAQGANIPLSEIAERRLHEKGIINLPDFIANAGGVICAAMEYRGASQATAFDTIEEKIRTNMKEVLDISNAKGDIPRDVAFGIAEQRVQRAMKTRRWSIF
ncbi:MAG: Glu/Leu/Phe/Val dehydrogenase [Rhodospirillales bacterium]|nr:Glu/Leu/Phe/Val dehydrogenase [Rhodospirillales bacterium]